jgi:1,4-dihydroxy-6-naphthoate synthase
MADRIIRVGHSPDPDDAFMFYGLSSGKVKLDGMIIEHQLEDIQTLNERALRGELHVTAISAHAYAYVADRYWIMATGASMGEGYGPVIVSKRYRTLDELRGKTIATPGKLTTATLLFKIFLEGIEHVDIPFDQIMDRVATGEFDAGLLIHEGQITYQSQGYHKVVDFGELWARMYDGLPLPLGLDVVRRDVGEETARALSRGLQQSIHYGYTHQREALSYALQYGRGINESLGKKFIKMYVSELTVHMGEKGKRALELLYRLGADRGVIPHVPGIQLY